MISFLYCGLQADVHQIEPIGVDDVTVITTTISRSPVVEMYVVLIAIAICELLDHIIHVCDGPAYSQRG